MEVVGKPAEVLPVAAEVQAEIDAAEGQVLADGRPSSASPSTSAPRRPIASIQTGERRFYGCFVFKKGVIPPDATG